MMKKNITIALLFLSLGIFAQETVTLRLKYEKGDAYLMKMETNQNMGMGDMKLTFDLNIDVKDVKDDVYSTEMSVKRVKAKMNQMGMDISYDSNDKEEDMSMMAKMMHGKMKGILDILIATETNDLAKVIAAKVVKGKGDADMITKNSNTVVYPKEPISKGYKWSQTITNSNIKMTYNYVVNSITSDSVLLDVDGVMSEGTTGTMKGTMKINKQTGIPTKSNMTINLDIKGQEFKSDVIITTTKI